jgi:hypothetical protein
MSVIIICADSREIAAEVVSQFDVMLTDPPFSAHVHGNATSQSAKRGTRKRDLGFESLTRADRLAIARHAASVKRWSVVHSDVEHSNWLSLAVQARGVEHVRTMPWVRWSMPQLSGDRPPPGFEHVLVYHPKGRKHWNGPGNLTHFDHLALRGEGKHKCEKPLDQALDIVSFFSDEGETVFDPYAGAGTFGVACRLLERNYIGIEKDEAWAAKAHARLAGPLSERDQERVERWLAADSEPVSALSEGPSLVRAAARARDKARVRATLGLAEDAPVPGATEADHTRLFTTDLWARMKPFAHFSSCLTRFARLDFLQLPEELRAEALAATSRCVSCGAVIHPFRGRQKSDRSRIAGTDIEWRLFYAAACPPDVNAGCTRTKAVKIHMERVRAMFPTEETKP